MGRAVMAESDQTPPGPLRIIVELTNVLRLLLQTIRLLGNRRILLSVAGLFVIGVALTLQMRPVVVLGRSMSPALQPGRTLWAQALRPGDVIGRGDIVIARLLDDTVIKRVYGLPGDTLYFLEVDGELLKPIRAAHVARRRATLTPLQRIRTIHVPADSFFLLGDNSAHSFDSRDFGPVHRRELIGRALIPTTVADALRQDAPPPSPART